MCFIHKSYRNEVIWTNKIKRYGVVVVKTMQVTFCIVFLI